MSELKLEDYIPARDIPQDAESRARLLKRLYEFDKTYPGGVAAYKLSSSTLLNDSRAGVNPFEGYTPNVPTGVSLQANTSAFDRMEEAGLEELVYTGFVLVAGGMGERLGFNGAKISLLSECTTGRPYMGLYADYLKAYEQLGAQRYGQARQIPLFIMTSDETHVKTMELLEKNDYFGLRREQVTIRKQAMVPALVDNDGHFAVDERGDDLIGKPHGHGDVHLLMHQSGTARRWADAGVRWVVFFQDTNGIAFRGLPATLGVSAAEKFDVNFVAVPRRPGEAVGSIVQLVHDDGRQLTCNVEYNQLDPLLRATVSPAGDVRDPATGFSPYPGNINLFVLAAAPYADVLARTNGLVPEFVNPKYADKERTVFTKPTRIECMMQDYPKLLGPESRVGFTSLDRWTCFSAVKNNVKDARAKFESTGFPECAASGEADIYAYFRTVLATHGVQVSGGDGEVRKFAGVPTAYGARIVCTPRSALTQADLRAIFPSPKEVSISARSTLVIDAPNVRIHRLELDGALVIRADDTPGTEVVVQRLKVVNDGWVFDDVDVDDVNVPEMFRIRGYTVRRVAQREIVYTQKPGKHIIDE